MNMTGSNQISITRSFAEPNSETFNIPPVRSFVQKYLQKSKVSVDPFARNKTWATYTNDLNPKTAAEFHYEAEQFLAVLAAKNVQADLLILDPPYSPRQIVDCYESIGLKSSKELCQMSGLLRRVRNRARAILAPEAIILSFGWNTNGMGKKHSCEILEILIVAHGSHHNDTLCLAERRLPELL